MSESRSWRQEQFDSAAQQQEASRLGMWAFLATEVMFFGGLFMAYIVYRHAFAHDFAVASRHTSLFYGTLNTAILLTSSLAMALAVHAAKAGDKKAIVRNITITVALAAAFLVVKGLEYHEDFREQLVPGPNFGLHGGRGEELFFYFYWVMTGLHALHVIIGMGLLSTIAVMAKRGRFSAEYHNPVEVSGLYWHFVDIVWIYLYPLLYLIGRHQ